MLVLDTSVTAAWIFPDEINDYCEAILTRLRTDGAVVPAIWSLEVMNVMLIGERQRRLAEVQTTQLLRFLQELPIQVDDAPALERLSFVLRLARQHHLSSYDASYLELAMRGNLPLATQDRSLREAAERAGVAIAEESA